MIHLWMFLVDVSDDAWRALPAVVLIYLAWGFKRMAARTLGLFEMLEQIDDRTRRIEESVKQ